MEFQMRVRSRVRNCPNKFSSGRVRARMIGPGGPPESWTSRKGIKTAAERRSGGSGERDTERRRREDPPNKTAKKV